MKKLLLIVATIVFCLQLSGQSGEVPAKKMAKLYPSKEIVSRYHNDWTQGHFRDRIKVFKAEPLQFGEIVFIGNSITESGKNWSERFGNIRIRNRGIGGDLTDGVLKRLDEIVYFKPTAVFILIGINDLSNLHHKEAVRKFEYDKIVPSPEYVGKNILKIAKVIHRKSPATEIYVRTLLPTRRDYLKDDILMVNKEIRENESKGIYQVVDLYSRFVDENGDLFEDLTTDGLHLNEKGYERWVEFERPILEKLSLKSAEANE